MKNKLVVEFDLSDDELNRLVAGAVIQGFKRVDMEARFTPEEKYAATDQYVRSLVMEKLKNG